MKLTVSFIAITLALAACKGTSVKFFNETLIHGSPPADKVLPLRYGGGLPIKSFDPNGKEGWCEATALLHARLFSIGGDGRVALDLVEEALPQEDGKTVRLRLRANAVFHDGVPVLASDVVATLEAVRARGESEVKGLLDAIREVRASSEHEVELVLSQPCPELPDALTEIAILPARLTADPAAMDETPIGAGPFKLVAQGPNWAEFVRHPGWHLGVPTCPSVDLKIIEDDRTRARAVANGELDLACVKPESLPAFAETARFTVHRYRSGAIRAIPLDVRAPGLDDPGVRKALGALIDREALVNEALGGMGRPAFQMLAEGNPAFLRQLHGPAMTKAEAVEKLERHGWVRGADGFLQKNGTPLTVRLVSWQGEAFRRKSAPLIVAAWKEAGVRAEVIPVDHAAYNKIARDLHGQAEGYVGGWGGLGAPVMVLTRKFSATGGQNRTGFNDPEIEDALRRAAQTPALGERVELVGQIARRLDDLMPWIPLVNADQIFVSTKRVTGIDFRVVDSWYEFPRLLAQARLDDPK